MRPQSRSKTIGTDTPALRGQALIEFAMVLPMIALLMVIGLDFGRVFFGWVAEMNIARAGASYAGLHPDAWALPYALSTPDNQRVQDTYLQRMEQDAQAINCALPAEFPAPVFIDANGNGRADQVNDLVKVSLSCGLTLLTPLAGSLIGNPLIIEAEAVFAIRGGLIDAPLITPLPSASATPQPTTSPSPAPTVQPCVVPQFIGDLKDQNALKSKWQNAGFVRNQLSITGGNWATVGSQSLIAGTEQPCATTSITVGP